MRAACCRFPFRKLACENPTHRSNPQPYPTERSFGVRPACCRFPSRKLACENQNHRVNPRASHLGIFNPASWRESRFSIRLSRSISSQQAGWKQKRQQAARTPKLRSECRRCGIHTSTGEAGKKSGLAPLSDNMPESHPAPRSVHAPSTINRHHPSPLDALGQKIFVFYEEDSNGRARRSPRQIRRAAPPSGTCIWRGKALVAQSGRPLPCTTGVRMAE